MTQQTSLEIKGNLVAHSVAELVSEAAHARLSGSLRLEDHDRKAILYFKAGKLSFAVSNARRARLFDMLISKGRFTREEIAEIPNFANDLEFAAHLEARKILDKKSIDELIREQIDAILIDVFSWVDGSWTFTPLAQVRDGLNFEVDVNPLLLQFARCLTKEIVLKRVQFNEDEFAISHTESIPGELLADELRTLDQFTDDSKNLRTFFLETSLSQEAAVRSVYTCWLIGLLQRTNWKPAFSDSAVAAFKRARLEIKREASRVTIEDLPAEKPEPTLAKAAEPAVELPPLSLDEYLSRVESAVTHYDVLGIEPTAEHTAIKRAYLTLAKQFHPDRFHKDAAHVANRVQSAFAELSKAHENLRTPEARELYDFRMRKEIADAERFKDGGDKSADQRIQQARISFEKGIETLRDGDADRAVPLFARAAHLDPKNAKYRAEYGRILAHDEKQKHKAEAEFQAAIGLAPEQPGYRLMLSQFFIDMNLRKRAEGELGRLLKRFPENREALALLQTLR